MARPSKEYCDYFPHQNNMRNHRKIRALRNKFKEKGYSIWNMLLEYLTGTKGHSFQNTDIEYELLAGDFEVSVTEIRQIVDYCIELQLLFIENGQIYSKSLLDELQPVYDKRTARKEFSEQQPREHGRFRSRNTVSQDPNGVSSTEMPQLDQIRSDQINNTIDTSYQADAGAPAAEKNPIVGISEPSVVNKLAKKKKLQPRKKKESPPETRLFNRIKIHWWEWFMGRNENTAPKFDGGSGSAITSICKYLITQGRKKDYIDEEMIYEFAFEQFALILARWEELKPNKYLYTSVDIKNISSNLNSIVNYFNHGSKIDFGSNQNGATAGSKSDRKMAALASWGLKVPSSDSGAKTD